jgi:hypothetical protein
MIALLETPVNASLCIREFGCTLYTYASQNGTHSELICKKYRNAKAIQILYRKEGRKSTIPTFYLGETKPTLFGCGKKGAFWRVVVNFSEFLEKRGSDHDICYFERIFRFNN